MGEVYAWSHQDEVHLVERFTGVPLSSIKGSTVDCIVFNTTAGELLLHGAQSDKVQTLCDKLKGGIAHSASFGRNHFVASTDAGIIFSQGEGSQGQHGHGHSDDLEQPFPLKVASQIEEVRAGSNHCVALTRGGNVYAWGTGYFGQHGGNARRPQMVPRMLSFQKCKISSIAVGDDFSLALATDGRIWAWGSNDCGQLGLGDTRARFKPQVVGSTFTDIGDGQALKENPLLISKANNAVESSWVSIAAGHSHAVACNAAGELFAWGFNMQGQLGQGESRKYLKVPTIVDFSNSGASDDPEDTSIAQVAAAGYFSAALSANGKVFTFGQMEVTGDDQPPRANAGTATLVRKLSDAKVRCHWKLLLGHALIVGC